MRIRLSAVRKRYIVGLCIALLVLVLILGRGAGSTLFLQASARVPMHLVYAQTPGWDWTAQDIQMAYAQTQAGIAYWRNLYNPFPEPRPPVLDIVIADLSVQYFPQHLFLDKDWSVQAIRYQHPQGYSIFIARSEPPMYDGKYGLGGWCDCDYGLLAIQYGDGHTPQNIAHEIGHLFGAVERSGYDEMDLMYGGLTWRVSDKTRLELRLP